MNYLFNERKPQSKAHLWDGRDSACRMWSTGGIRPTRDGWVVDSNARGRLVCHMCSINSGACIPAAEPQLAGAAQLPLQGLP